MLTDCASAYRHAIEDEHETATGIWQSDADSMMRARAGLLDAVWSQHDWPETLAAARSAYDFVYGLSPRSGNLSELGRQRALAKLKGLVTSYTPTPWKPEKASCESVSPRL